MVKAVVPNFFICPISLELMKDPVTLTTGQTYDRRSIEKWFAEGQKTCPSTMQVLPTMDIAPNHTLQKLIHQWCASNNYCHDAAPEALPPAVSSNIEAKRRTVVQIVQELVSGGEDLHHKLKELRVLAKDLDQGLRNRVALIEAGAVPILANLVFSPESLEKDAKACLEALAVLTLLPLNDIGEVVDIGPKQLTALSWLLNRGSIDGRVNAALLLCSLTDGDTNIKASVANTSGIFEGLVQLLKEELYFKAIQAGSKAILSLLSNGPERNINRAVEAGVVFAVVDRLLETQRKSQLHTLTNIMELLCSSVEGREAAIAHALVVPLLVKVILSNSPAATESALSCLWTICKHSPEKWGNGAAGQEGILMELSHVGQSSDHQISHNPRAAQLLRQLKQGLEHCTHIF